MLYGCGYKCQIYCECLGNETCQVAENQSSYACHSSYGYCVDKYPGYSCDCRDGYEGNPYLEDGCQGLSLKAW